MRLSRGCYDKFHRCPGWNGGGPKYPQRRRCNGGRIQVNYEARLWRFRFWRCNRCNVVVWPYATRYLSPWEIASDVKYWWRNRQYHRQWNNDH